MIETGIIVPGVWDNVRANEGLWCFPSAPELGKIFTAVSPVLIGLRVYFPCYFPFFPCYQTSHFSHRLCNCRHYRKTLQEQGEVSQVTGQNTTTCIKAASDRSNRHPPTQQGTILGMATGQEIKNKKGKSRAIRKQPS